MAGDWIPMRMDLADDPAVVVIGEACGIDEYAVVGRLHKLWSWANKHLSSGNARGVTEKWIDRYLCADGFASALIQAGWVTSKSGELQFVNYDRWNSQNAKKRLQTAKRVALHKAEKGNATSVTNALPKEEKRREEKREEKYTPQPPADAGGAVVETPKPARRERKQASSAGPESIPIPDALNHDPFPATWAEWIAERRERRKPLTARAAKGQLLGLEPLGPAKAAECVSASIRNGWVGLFPERDDGNSKPPPMSFRERDRMAGDALLDALTAKDATDAKPDALNGFLRNDLLAIGMGVSDSAA